MHWHSFLQSMSFDVSPNGTESEHVIGFEGEYTVADVRRFVEQLDADVPVTRVSLTIAPEDRVSVRIPVTGDDDAEDGAPAPIETSARVQIDSIPFQILTVLESTEEPLRTEEVYDALTDTDLSQNAIASRLWNLYKRGLVDKQPYPEDKRQKVYSLTGRGVYALEAARERAE